MPRGSFEGGMMGDGWLLLSPQMTETVQEKAWSLLDYSLLLDYCGQHRHFTQLVFPGYSLGVIADMCITLQD